MLAPLTVVDVAPSPKQTRLLGALVRGVGIIVTVSQSLQWGYVLIEDSAGKRHHAFLRDLTKDQLEYPDETPDYYAAYERVSYGLWDDVFSVYDNAQRLAAVA